jgi:hypothetical protein
MRFALKACTNSPADGDICASSWVSRKRRVRPSSLRDFKLGYELLGVRS